MAAHEPTGASAAPDTGQAPNTTHMTAGSPEGMSLPLAAQQQLLPKLEAAGNAATLLPPQSQPFADFKAAAAAAGIKVCENCGTTSTPLWRKDKQTGMMMCNACGIFFKHHQMHRPVELMTQPPRSHQQLLAPCPVAASLLLASGYSDQEGAAGLSGGWEAAARGRKRTVPEESDYSEQSDDDPEERRRSLRPRRTRQHAEEYLLELRVAALAGPAAATAGEQESPDAGALDSDGGSELSSVHLVDEAVAERQRVALINRLVKEALTADYDGAIEGLKSLKQARITDPATGQSYGLVRLYADPGQPAAAAVAAPAPRAARAAAAAPHKPAKHVAVRSGGGGPGGKSAQTCYNCSTTSTPLWRKERETGRMYCNACGIFKKTHGIERPLGTSRFKQYSGPGPQPRSRGKRSRGGKGGSSARRTSAGKAGSPGVHGSESELEQAEMMTASDSEAEEAEEPVAQRRRTSLATTPPPPAPLAVESVAAEAAAEDGGALRTVSGRTVRPPRNRLGESAAVTSPDLAAAEAAQVAEYEAVEAIRRQQQLPLLPGSLSLFKAAPTPPPAVASVAVPLVTVQQQGAALSASSDASAYSQPPSATAATAHLAASGGICSLQGVLAGTEAGFTQLPATLQLSAARVVAPTWPVPGMERQQWAAALPPSFGVPTTLPGVPL